MTPHQRLSHNPLFAAETRHKPPGTSAAMLLDSSGRWIGISAGVVFALWLLPALIGGTRAGDDWLDQAAVLFVTLAIVGSLLVSLVLDFLSISTTLSSILGEQIARRWDLLRLTPLKPAQIVAAKHGTAQVRVWRLMALIVGLRLAVVGMVSLTVIVQLIGISSDERELLDLSAAPVLMLLVVFAVYLVEPLWRLRAMTALGVAVSARSTHHTSAALGAIGTLIAFWIVQGFVISVLMIGVSLLFVPLMIFGSLIGISLLSAVLLAVVLVVAVYGFFSTVQTLSLRRAEHAVARSVGHGN